MKLNPGHYVAMAFVGFAAFILYMVFQTFTYNLDLVSEDYYSQELKYQKQIDKMNNLNQSGLELKYTLSDSAIVFQFPDSGQVSGSIVFYRPSDAKKDVNLTISADKNTFTVPRSKLVVGLYKMKVDWVQNQVPYLFEKDIYIQ